MSSLQVFQEFIPSVDGDSVVTGGMRPGVSSMIPKRNGARQALQDIKLSISKVKYLSYVDHILRQSGNRSQRIFPTDHTVKREHYVEELSRLLQRIR
jgi:hypothetical protein